MQVVARGRRVFPFARVVVTLVAAEAERRTLLQAAFGERLGDDVREAMEGSGCELPHGFSVEVRTAEAGLRRLRNRVRRCGGCEEGGGHSRATGGGEGQSGSR